MIIPPAHTQENPVAAPMAELAPHTKRRERERGGEYTDRKTTEGRCLHVSVHTTDLAERYLRYRWSVNCQFSLFFLHFSCLFLILIGADLLILILFLFCYSLKEFIFLT